MARPVELGGEHGLGQREAHGVAESLAERPGGHLHPWHVPALGVARREAAPLAERVEVVEGEAVSGEMNQGVEERAGMPVGEDEAITVEPVWCGWRMT